ncbi:MAG: NUDIX domain-containing protein [Patescibacteria group bacterium]
MPAKKISIERAKQDKLFYFVANVVVYRPSDGRCLILKRSEKEKVHPGRWCAIGGKLEWGDMDISRPTRLNGDVLDFENAVERLLAREAKEEAGIEIEQGLSYLNSVAFVRPDEVPVVLVKFAARYKNGDVVVEKDAFADCAWVNNEEAQRYPCIDGITEEIAKTIELFNRNQNLHKGKRMNM